MNKSDISGIRVGIGYDTHVFEEQRKLYLGGIFIPGSFGLKAHSDGDVLLHAIIDALLGASGLGDIGQLFPPSDEKYKDISSVTLLKHVIKKVQVNFKLINIDSVIICEKPKISAYAKDIQKNLETLTGALAASVKATTTEGMNDEGRGLCISAQAVVLLAKTL